ncbi:helix-turn-helix domain-containing protein [Vagococcus sp. BWB3-3]|uniref:Helix-turn-helix domain-containing protein n=1 Tax=Vagococcus allomyrinae TaxID=2794353 RepID=A0A940PA75_9ENTE|nr:helix-turn-helix domain-containing protein [Vagococcus allomyrinae]MBP1040990.1 helix-turn-helix domain-containing protein [Vagococcus allomyrinae]
MKNIIGDVYKQIRINKGISQQDICQNKISRTTLSRFENGKVDVSLTHFHFFLKQLDISYDEFDFILNGYQANSKTAIFDAFFSLHSSLDTKKIKGIIKQCEKFLKNGNNWYIESILKIMSSFLQLGENAPDSISPFSQQFVEEIWQRLSAQDEWYMIDFRIINYILFLFPTEVAIQIGNEVLKRSRKYQHFRDIDPLNISLKLNMALLCLQQGQHLTAAKVANQAITSAKKIKRYDFLMIGLVRHGIATQSRDQINEGLLLAKIVNEEHFKEELQKEVLAFLSSDFIS